MKGEKVCVSAMNFYPKCVTETILSMSFPRMLICVSGELLQQDFALFTTRKHLHSLFISILSRITVSDAVPAAMR